MVAQEEVSELLSSSLTLEKVSDSGANNDSGLGHPQGRSSSQGGSVTLMRSDGDL